MPNAWNAGSACMLEDAGFPAIGTTSDGIAFCLGLPDYEGLLTREAALEETKRIAAAVRVPVSADAENGYGDSPEDVAETIRLVAQTGAVGASIEDYTGRPDEPLYERTLAIERIQAARNAADSLDVPFTLTGRAECYLVNHPEAFEESVVRANLYRAAGADCLYVPGIKDLKTISAMVKEIDGPINVVMGLAGNPLTIKQLEDVGVKRVSVGGTLARVTFGAIRRAAKELRESGTFQFAKQQVPDEELCRFFLNRLKRSTEDRT